MRKSGKSLDLPLPDRIELLRSVPMFAGLGDEEIKPLSNIGRWATLAKGTTLFDEGDRGEEMFVVARGRVGIFKSTMEGEKFLAERRKGEVIGEMAILDGRQRSATAITQTDCVLLSIHQVEFVASVKKNPAVALEVIANLANRLREADERVTVATTLDAMGRLAHYLLSEARYFDHRQVVRPRKPDSFIAERIGSTRETVNRKLAELGEERVIRKTQHFIELLDEDHLRGLAGE